MSDGSLESIHLVADGGGDPEEVEEVAAVPGRGLDGDRYAEGEGTWSKPEQKSDVTLVAAEAAEHAARTLDAEVRPGDLRRNLVTRGVDLDALIGRRFHVGEVVMEGERPCHPCGYLERRTGLAGLEEALSGRGGLRARIVRGGVIRRGDPVRPLES